MVFMLIASANFSLHFLAWRNKSLLPYLRDSEYRFFLFILALSAIVVVASLISQNLFSSNTVAARQGMFHLISVATYKQGRKEIVRLVHPNAVLSIKTGGQVISEKVISTVTAFFSMYVFCYVLTGFALSAAGLDWITAFSAAAACLNNLGPGLAGVADNYASINDTAKWILSFAMLLGRLELFTLLVLFTATFWRD